MSKIKRNRAKGELRNRHSRRKVMLIVGTILSLILTSGALAQWAGIISVTQQKGDIAPANFEASSPSKRYIYAGGKLVATEEPSVPACGSGPGTPTGLMATATPTPTISLSWNAPSGAVDHYDIERK